MSIKPHKIDVYLKCKFCEKNSLYNHPDRWPQQFEMYFGKYTTGGLIKIKIEKHEMTVREGKYVCTKCQRFKESYAQRIKGA